MPAVVSDSPCTICLIHEPVMHSHHTIPQARGGKHSKQIILCSSCHNILHANAVHVKARINNSSLEPKSFWRKEEDRLRAEPWLQILVRSLISTEIEESGLTEHRVGAVLNMETFKLFKILAADLGCSQEKAVEYCIKYVLTKRGFKSDKTKPDLWFLPVSGKR